MSQREAAAGKAYPKCEAIPCDQFEVAFQAVELWIADRAVLPVENPQLLTQFSKPKSCQQDPVATMRRGLDPLVLRSLPVVVFPSDDFKDGLECAVCLSELVHGEKARRLPKCSHGFHVDCIDMWFQSHSTCPLCRNPVAPGSSAHSSTSAVEKNGEFRTRFGFEGRRPFITTRLPIFFIFVICK